MLNLTHSYKLNNNFNANVLYNKVSSYLTETQGLRVQLIKATNGVAIQATSGDKDWKKFIGMDKALTIRFEYQGDIIAIDVGQAKWIDKAGAAAVGAIVFWPLLITSAVGVFSQAQLPKDLMKIVNNYMIIAGCSEMDISTNVSLNYNIGGYDEVLVKNAVSCPKCAAQCTYDSMFCSKCGTKI